MVSCCSCPVTPNGLVSLAVNSDLVSNTVIPVGTLGSLVIKIVGSLPTGNTCVNSAGGVTVNNLANGAEGISTTLHLNPARTGVVPTQTPFSRATLSAGELTRLSTLCNAIIGNGSGFGVCRSCRLGALGSEKQ